ncbi:hypothetical protein [Halobacillus sp. Marseille-P3879]|uniref:hypothetical protein n=1 Tax=Halobacillus sp. Marseille-P3879 TaxID=2045014 RepID=UPI000C7D886F|nr:hypothetical protein [Halobacillus sp. Marseille-P3879]
MKRNSKERPPSTPAEERVSRDRQAWVSRGSSGARPLKREGAFAPGGKKKACGETGVSPQAVTES